MEQILNFNIFEIVEQADDCDRVYETEEFVCSFENESDAKDFAETNSVEYVYTNYPKLKRGTYKVYPGYFVPHSMYQKGMDPRTLLASITAPKVADPVEAGYDIFTEADCKTIFPGALHIERMDLVRKYPDDYAAAKQAEKDGIPIIHDMEGVEDWTYVDTHENRALIETLLPKHPECDIRNWRKRGGNL